MATTKTKTDYPLHTDYQRSPRFTFSFKPLIVNLLNGFLKLQRWPTQRKVGEGVSREWQILPLAGRNIKSQLIKPLGVNGPLPLLLYYHGGAFALGYGSSHVRACELLARRCHCAVLLVDYRLAPKHKFPAGFDDCYESLDWSIEQAAALGIDPARIAVGGDSAGGALAAGVAQKAQDQGIALVGQMLIYPVLDNSCSTGSAIEFVDVPVWNTHSNQRMWAMYLPGGNSDSPPAYAAPSRRDNLQGQPPAYVDTAEFDPLRDEALAYNERLQQAGVATVLRETRGTIHGYDAMASNEVVSASIEARVEFLNKVFSV